MLVALDGLDAVAAAVARARLVIGIRLHALIFAARFGVPFLAVPYDPKVAGLTEDLAYPLPPLWTPGERFVAARIDGAVDAAWERRDELAAHLLAQAPIQRAQAARNFEVLAALTR
jgi:polysaccharide pyruvyl transferase WcaK-like protein